MTSGLLQVLAWICSLGFSLSDCTSETLFSMLWNLCNIRPCHSIIDHVSQENFEQSQFIQPTTLSRQLVYCISAKSSALFHLGSILLLIKPLYYSCTLSAQDVPLMFAAYTIHWPLSPMTPMRRTWLLVVWHLCNTIQMVACVLLGWSVWLVLMVLSLSIRY